MPKAKRNSSGEGVPRDVKQKEGRALHALWKTRKRRTQAEFADSMGYTQGYLPQFFAGLRPLTLEIAQAFAEELEVDISQFSTRLAEEFSNQLQETAWPFRTFSRDDFVELSSEQRRALEAVVGAFLGNKPTPADRPVVAIRKPVVVKKD